MKQPDKRTPFLFITLGIVAILLLLIDMATYNEKEDASF